MLGAKQCTRVKNMPRDPKGERRPADVIRNTVHVMRSTPEEGKDPAAVALGRKGGKARAEGMSAKRRKEIARTAARNRPAGIVEALAVAPFPRAMCQGGCVKESSSQGQFPSRGSGGLADRPLGDQAAAGDWEGIVVDRRQLVPGRKRDDQITMTLQRAPCHDQAAICRAGEGRDGALDLAGRARRSGSHPPRARTPRPEEQ